MSYQPVPPRKRKAGLLPWFVGAIVLVSLVGCGGLFLVILGAPPATVPDAGLRPFTSAPTGGARAGKAAAPSTKPTLKTRIGEGEFKVGTHVAAGTYRTEGAEASAIQLCTWVVSNDSAGKDVLDYGVTDSTEEPGEVDLKKGQHFKSSGCQEWVKQ